MVSARTRQGILHSPAPSSICRTISATISACFSCVLFRYVVGMSLLKQSCPQTVKSCPQMQVIEDPSFLLFCPHDQHSTAPATSQLGGRGRLDRRCPFHL